MDTEKFEKIYGMLIEEIREAEIRHYTQCKPEEMKETVKAYLFQ